MISSHQRKTQAGADCPGRLHCHNRCQNCSGDALSPLAGRRPRILSLGDTLFSCDWNLEIANYRCSPDTAAAEAGCCLWCHCHDLAQRSSFGLILYELITARAAFRKRVPMTRMGLDIVALEERPKIPDHVLSAARKLVGDCWRMDPAECSLFGNISSPLKAIKFKVMSRVNSTKVADFVRKFRTHQRNWSLGVRASSGMERSTRADLFDRYLLRLQKNE
jgi:hypothetical protein